MFSQLASLPPLLLLCSAMLVGTYLAGLLPLYLPLSKRSLKLLQIAGAGMLLGASMTVVLPEGVGALWRGQDEQTTKSQMKSLGMGIGRLAYAQSRNGERDELEHGHGDEDHDEDGAWDPEKAMGVAMIAGFLVMFFIDQFSPSHHSHSHSHSQLPTRNSRARSPPETLRLRRASDAWDAPSRTERNSNPPPTSPNYLKSSSSSAAIDVDSTSIQNPDNDLKTGEDDDRNASNYSPEHLPVDYDSANVERNGSHHEHVISGDRSSIVSPLLRSHSEASRRSRVSNGGQLGYEGSHTLSDALPSVIGLMLHAAADGIAMGATAGSNDEGLKAVVFLAIIVHKAPAAFGLCTLLMSRGLRKIEIQKGLALFSLSTPVGAIVTYLLLTLFLPPVPLLSSAASSPPSISSTHIGLALIFSGGTFLYVALHAMQEVTSDSSEEEDENSSASTTNTGRSSRKWRKIINSLVLALGAMAPKLMQSLVGHHH